MEGVHWVVGNLHKLEHRLGLIPETDITKCIVGEKGGKKKTSSGGK